MQESFQFVSRAGQFYIKDAVSVYSQFNSFEMCYVAQKGGAIQFINIKDSVYDRDSSFIDLAAWEGGALFIDGSKVTLRNTRFSNVRALSGGSIVAYNDAAIDMKALNIVSSSAIE